MENKFEVWQKVRYMNEDYPLLNGRIFTDFNLSQNNTMENLKDLRFENFANKNKKKIISISEELIEKQKLFDEMKKFFYIY